MVEHRSVVIFFADIPFSPTAPMAKRRSTPPRSGQAPPSGPLQGQQRLQRVLAAADFGSRRQCEELITAGRVEVDGQIVTQLGTRVDPLTSKIYVDGTLVKSAKPVYFALHKPTGVVSSTRDPEGRPRVIDLLPPDQRVFPVGRLDLHSEGLMLLTNDGALTDQLTHPRYGVQKVYLVTVAGEVTAEAMRRMREGIYIAEGRVRVDGARVLRARPRATEMEIRLREGKNREIRRILASLGHKVQKLKRVAIGSLRLGELPKGAYRQLTPQEIGKLKTDAFAAASAAPSPRGSATKGAGRRAAKPSGARSDAAKGRRSGAAAERGPVTDPLALSSDSLPDELLGSGPYRARTGSIIGEQPGADAVQPPAPGRRSRKKIVGRKATSQGTARPITGGRSSTAPRKPGAKKRSPARSANRGGSDRVTRSGLPAKRSRRGAAAPHARKKRGPR